MTKQWHTSIRGTRAWQAAEEARQAEAEARRAEAEARKEEAEARQAAEAEVARLRDALRRRDTP